jgi:hypothetical protein
MNLVALATTAISLVFFLVSVLICRISRTLENKLILLGIVTVTAAVMLSLHEAEGVQTSVTVPGTNQRCMA